MAVQSVLMAHKPRELPLSKQHYQVSKPFYNVFSGVMEAQGANKTLSLSKSEYDNQLNENNKAMRHNICSLPESEYVYQLKESEVEDIKAGLQAWKDLCAHLSHEEKEGGLDLSLISRNTFVLPMLGPILRKKSLQLHSVTGLGFFLVRGFDFNGFSEKEKLAIHAGICSWIGDQRAVQNGDLEEERNVALHVIDFDEKKIHETNPGKFVATANTTVAMPFHSDAGDIISLHYRELAESGGEFFVANMGLVYSILRGCHEEDFKILQQNWEWDMPGNKERVVRRPLIYETKDHDGIKRYMVLSERRPFFGHSQCRRSPDLAPISLEQTRALETIQQVARGVAVKLSIQRNDIVFLHNYTNLHARSAFEDANGPKRHVVRMVVRDNEFRWAEPEGLKRQLQSMFERVAEKEQHWSVPAAMMSMGGQHG